MTITHHRFMRTLRFMLVCCAATLFATGSARAAQSCDSMKDCDSDVNVSSDGQGGCTYSWPTRSYLVAKNFQPYLLWRIRDANFKWDGSLGITLLTPPTNDPQEDLDVGGAVSAAKDVFRWLTVQAPTQSGTNKLFTIDMVITQASPVATCLKAKGEPDYTIELKR